MDLKELKQQVIDAIDARKEDIYAIGDSIFEEPELGYKEYKTADKIKKVFDDLEIDYRDEVALTGVVGTIESENPKYHIAVMSELDSVISPKHPAADKETGAAHCCGHNAMVAAMIGVAYALSDTDLLEKLEGKISFMGIPSEEYVEIGFRNQLIEEGKISFLGGKQEFIKLGEFDDVDITMMHHLFSSENEDSSGIKAAATQTSNGFIGQQIEYFGVEAHAGGAPHLGKNALQSANIAMAAINANRETFRDEDVIRVHPIITEGGQIVNTVPGYVKIESYVRASTVDGILNTIEKVNNSWKAGALAIGTKVKISSTPGYLPEIPDENLVDIMYENLKLLFGEDATRRVLQHGAGSTDVGDVAAIVPTVQARIGGVKGDFHAENFQYIDKDIAYLDTAKAMAMTIVDLLYEDGKLVKKVKDEFEPIYTKEEYLSEWGKVGEKYSEEYTNE